MAQAGVAALTHDRLETVGRENRDAVQAAAGDALAFERLYSSHLGRIHGLVRRMAGPGDAEEITQDVFVRAWQKLGTFRGEAAFSTWLHRLAVNVVVERFRSAATRRAKLHDVEGYKHDEIAAMLEISSGTSKAQLHRARMLLRKRL